MLQALNDGVDVLLNAVIDAADIVVDERRLLAVALVVVVRQRTSEGRQPSIAE